LSEGINFFIQGNFYKEFEKYIKKALKAGSSLHTGPVKGNVEGFIYWDFRERKRNHIWAPLLWTQRTLTVKCGGHLAH
jgi:hypothetical protein